MYSSTTMISTTTLTRKGQVTVPLEIRQKLGMRLGQKVNFEEIDDRSVILRPGRDALTLFGFFNTKKKYNKKQAQRTYLKDVLKGRI